MANQRIQASGGEVERLAARVRALIESIVTVSAPPEVLVRATAGVEQALSALAPHLPATRPPRYPKQAAFETPNDLMPFDPVVGRLNPIAPPIEFRWEDDKSVGRVRFGTVYEGPPGCVHGGVIAAAFDQVLNLANIARGAPGPTVRLVLHFRKPTPLDTDLVFEGWQEREEGNRLHTRGRLRYGDTVTVEAEGIFVKVPVERVLKMLD